MSGDNKIKATVTDLAGKVRDLGKSMPKPKGIRNGKLKAA